MGGETLVYRNVVDLMHEQIGEALREPAFRVLFNTVEKDRWEAVVGEQLARRNVKVSVLSVTKAPEGVKQGEYILDWQPEAGGREQQWFSPSQN
jgi:hypothetical protein